MRLFKIGATYYIRTDPVTGRKLSTKCTSKRAAELWVKEREKLAANPAYRASHEATLGDWADRTLEAKRLAGKANGTVEMYRIKLGHVVRLLGEDASLVGIGAPTFEAYWGARRDEGASDATTGKELVCLRQLLKRAKRAGEYAGDLSALWPEGLSLRSEPKRRWLRPEELPKLKAVCSAEEWAWVAACISTSGRLSEVARLRAEDYSEKDRTVRVRGTKTEGADRLIPILPQFAPLWAEALPHLPVSWANVSKRLPERCLQAGLEHATPNDLRRTHATWLVQAGVSHELVAKMLGHTTTAMVYRTYGRLEGKELGAAIGVPKTSKSPTEPPGLDNENSIEDPTKAPWRNGRRGGFKSQCNTRVSAAPPEITDTCEPKGAPQSTGHVLETSKRRHSPAAWGLAAIAHQMGVL